MKYETVPIYGLIKMIVSAMHDEERPKVPQREMTPELVKEYMQKWKPHFQHACEYLTFDFLVKEAIEENAVVYDFLRGVKKAKIPVNLVMARQLFTNQMSTTIMECNQIIMNGVPDVEKFNEAKISGDEEKIATLYSDIFFGKKDNISERDKMQRSKVYMEAYLCFKKSLMSFRDKYGLMID